MADPIIDGIEAIARGHERASWLMSYLSICGDLVGIPEPRKPTRMQRAEYAFARVAAWITILAVELPTLKAAIDVDGAVLDEIDRLAVVNRIHSDHSMFATCLSASRLAITPIMAAQSTGSPLLISAFKMVGQHSGHLHDPENLKQVTEELTNMEPGCKYSLSDDLQHGIELQREESTRWFVGYSKLETALSREQIVIEELRNKTASKRRRFDRKPLMKKVAELHDSGVRCEIEIRSILHAKHKQLMEDTPSKRQNPKYPSRRQLDDMIKEGRKTPKSRSAE